MAWRGPRRLRSRCGRSSTWRPTRETSSLPQLALYQIATRPLFLAGDIPRGQAGRRRASEGRTARQPTTSPPQPERTRRRCNACCACSSASGCSRSRRTAASRSPLGTFLRRRRAGQRACGRAAVRRSTRPRQLGRSRILRPHRRAGVPQARRHRPFAEMAKDPETAANFDAAMADFTRMTAIAVAGSYDFGPLRTVVDVGGGNGTLLVGILKAFPHLRAPSSTSRTSSSARRRRSRRAASRDRCRSGRRRLLPRGSERRRRLSREARDPRLGR